jgi:hypothetical protein
MLKSVAQVAYGAVIGREPLRSAQGRLFGYAQGRLRDGRACPEQSEGILSAALEPFPGKIPRVRSG